MNLTVNTNTNKFIHPPPTTSTTIVSHKIGHFLPNNLRSNKSCPRVVLKQNHQPDAIERNYPRRTGSKILYTQQSFNQPKPEIQIFAKLTLAPPFEAHCQGYPQKITTANTNHCLIRSNQKRTQPPPRGDRSPRFTPKYQ